ncbi:LytR/AlgR family response regulator transcription factor [Saccharicrinis aurantiacus]|uniref:LytR/AlgR family response regulator transcription factor n=1 Tax=Saccharicrinis aurantiacus TaxID=1849719 RepID=UPI00094F89CE|nr:response regulator [Saccharicrinis aurantiacus]
MKHTYTTLIIDDEAPARALIKSYLEKWTQLKVVGECANGFEALKAIKEHKPDLIFLDIQMPKVTGLELLEVLDEAPQVIFTTAYDQYALKAFELNAVDYLLKPFSVQRFDEAVNKVLAQLQGGVAATNLPSPSDIKEDALLDRIVVKKGINLSVLSLDKVLYIEAQTDFVSIHTEEERFLKSKTMAYFEAHLPSNNFIRIHRSYIVNTNAIKGLEPYDKDTYLAIISPDVKLKVSRTGYKRLREMLNF